MSKKCEVSRDEKRVNLTMKSATYQSINNRVNDDDVETKNDAL